MILVRCPSALAKMKKRFTYGGAIIGFLCFCAVLAEFVRESHTGPVDPAEGFIVILMFSGLVPLGALVGLFLGWLGSHSAIRPWSGPSTNSEPSILKPVIFFFSWMGCHAILLLLLTPIMIAARSPSQESVCRVNRHAIEKAKIKWAKEERKTANDIPTDTDLFGPGKYLERKPTCPSLGTYTLGKLGEPVTCSLEWHSEVTPFRKSIVSKNTP